MAEMKNEYEMQIYIHFFSTDNTEIITSRIFEALWEKYSDFFKKINTIE